MSDRAIAFLDILGFSNLSCSLPEKEILEIVAPFYLHADSNNEQKKIFEDIGLSKLHSTETTFFSDSLVISCAESDVGKLIISIKSLSKEMIRHGLFLRGGIACGKLFHEERVVFGKAMNEAYLLESNQAVYPRVILSESTYKLCLENCNKPVSDEEYIKLSGAYRVNEELKPLRMIHRDSDGFRYINPFPLHLGPVAEWKLVSDLRTVIERNLEKYSKDKKDIGIYKKYYWLAYKYNEFYKENDKIDEIKI